MEKDFKRRLKSCSEEWAKSWADRLGGSTMTSFGRTVWCGEACMEVTRTNREENREWEDTHSIYRTQTGDEEDYAWTSQVYSLLMNYSYCHNSSTKVSHIRIDANELASYRRSGNLHFDRSVLHQQMTNWAPRKTNGSESLTKYAPRLCWQLSNTPLFLSPS